MGVGMKNSDILYINYSNKNIEDIDNLIYLEQFNHKPKWTWKNVIHIIIFFILYVYFLF